MIMIIDDDKNHAQELKEFLLKNEIYATIHSFQKAEAGFCSLSPEAQEKANKEAEKYRKYLFSGPRMRRIRLRYRRNFKPAKITVMILSSDYNRNLNLIKSIRQYANHTVIAAAFMKDTGAISIDEDMRQIINSQCDYTFELGNDIEEMKNIIIKIMMECYGLDLRYIKMGNLALFSEMPKTERLLFYKDRYMHISDAQYAIIRFLMYNHPVHYDASEILRYCLHMREKQKNYFVSTAISQINQNFRNELSDDGKTSLICNKYGSGYGILT